MSRHFNQVVRAIVWGLLAISASHTPTAKAALVASYGFNETSGSSAFDSSGNTRTATIAGGTALGVAGNPYLGVGNKAFQFDGVNDTVTRSSDAAFAPGTFVANSGWTVETWFKVAPSNTYAFGFVSWYVQAGGVPTYQLMLDGAGHPRGWTRNNAGVNPGFLTSTTDVRDNEWHHLAMTFGHNGSNTPFRNLYLDGTLTASDLPASLGTMSGTTALTMGWFDGFGSGDDRFFNGAIDQVNIYSHALTAAQILANYQAGLPVPEPSTFALFSVVLLGLACRRSHGRGLQAA